MTRFTPLARWARAFAAGIGLAALAGAGWAGANRFRQAQADNELPVATAKKGEFVALIRCRGDIKASHSVPIYAPIVPNLTISWMADAGQEVQEGKPIIKFDSSSVQQQLTQKEATLAQAQATLDQALGDAKATSEHDKADLEDAKYTVEKARLATAANEFVGRIQAAQTAIDLTLAEQKLRVQEANVALHEATAKSKVASLTRQRDQAKDDVALTKSRIAQMEIKAPLTGLVTFANNNSQGWFNAKPFKVGDNVFAGMNLAEIPDMTSLVMDAKAEETDRGSIAVGKDVRLRIDALPELTIEATISSISPLTELDRSEWPPTRSFRAYAAMQHPDTRLRPGMNGAMDIITNRIPNAISIPAKGVFTRAGKPIVYIADKGHYTPVEIQVLLRNPDEVAISGIADGTMVALADPEKKDAKK